MISNTLVYSNIFTLPSMHILLIAICFFFLLGFTEPKLFREL